MISGLRTREMGSGTHVRRRLEALHRLPEALAELGELARPEEHRRDAADDDELGEAEAEQTHRGDGPAPRTPGTPRGDDARAERRGLAQERGRGSGQARHGARLGRLRLRRGGLAAGEPGAHDRGGRGEGSHDDSFMTWKGCYPEGGQTNAETCAAARSTAGPGTGVSCCSRARGCARSGARSRRTTRGALQTRRPRSAESGVSENSLPTPDQNRDLPGRDTVSGHTARRNDERRRRFSVRYPRRAAARSSASDGRGYCYA